MVKRKDGDAGDPARTDGVGPTFDDAIAHATGADGVIDLRKLDALEGRFGTNGGRGCDVLEGPCSCGAWHFRDERKEG